MPNCFFFRDAWNSFYLFKRELKRQKICVSKLTKLEKLSENYLLLKMVCWIKCGPQKKFWPLANCEIFVGWLCYLQKCLLMPKTKTCQDNLVIILGTLSSLNKYTRESTITSPLCLLTLTSTICFALKKTQLS